MDWCAASICQTVFAANGVKSNLSDHLLRFDDPTTKTKPDSKDVWLALFGLN